MDPFTKVTAVAAPLDLPNIDTDRVIPARFLRRPQDRYAGLLFHDVRFDDEGHEREDFVLNQAPFREAKVLVVADNFGCGSSREAAVWALQAHGIRSVIAPSLGDIFHENCYKNGLLPVILAPEIVTDLRAQLHANPGATMTVDLERQAVIAPDGRAHRFEVDAFRKQALLSGQDEIALTLSYEKEIAAFEARRAAGGAAVR
jgi:3-isopropylmalate/(R)-2-methylmalate dehydratase small subunit